MYVFDPIKLSMSVAQAIADAVPSGIQQGHEALFVTVKVDDNGGFSILTRFGDIAERPGQNVVRIDIRPARKT